MKLEDLNQESIEFVPGKLVTVRKAGPDGGKKKCRAVVCGNLLQGDLDPPPGSPYASGADGILIRAALSYAVERRWGIATTDIRTAFLHAPRPKLNESREVIVVSPKILVTGGVCAPNERWRVHNALYGFTSSPAHWAVHRDRMMAEFEWSSEGSKMVLKRSEEGNLWKIMKQSPTETEWTCEGHVIVYVDDIMVMANDQVRNDFFTRLQKEWKCSDIETVNTDNWVRFCGFELKKHDQGEGLMVGQKSYTLDLLKRHQDLTPKQYPMPKGDAVGIEEENPTVDDIRKAQGVTGELLWLAGRSRPDISYAVSCMGRGVLKRPKWVQQIGRHVLGFLMNTSDVCLLYRPCRKDHGVGGNLQVPRHERLLEAFADISYAPEGDRSHQGIIICAAGSPIQWEATRQAFHTMSTSESELVGYCEATTMLKSAEALLKVLHGPHNDDGSFEKVIYGDNTSALSILTNPDGGWRTRHLRLRSSCLRELIRDDPKGWKIRHQKGSDLPADMLTKPIVVQKDWARFWCFLGFHVDNGSGLISSSKLDSFENFPSHPPPSNAPGNDCDDPEVAKERNEAKEMMMKVQAAVMIAALAAVVSKADVGPKITKACATGVAAFARWLHKVDRHDGQQDCRPKAVCTEGREEEETKRAIGLKKTKRKCQDAREENEPANEGQSREKNEPDWLEMLREKERNEPSISERKDTRNRCLVDKGTPENDPKNGVFGVVGQRREGGSEFVEGAQVIQSDFTSMRNFTGSRSPVDFDHCPSGCPSSQVVSGSAAMDGLPRLAALRCGLDGRLPCGDEWETTRFWSPPVVRKDVWEVAYLEKGWLVRSHGDRRVRRFHPVHRGVPIDVSLLEGPRITVSFDDRGERSVTRDLWTDPPCNQYTPKRNWVGWTFLKVREGREQVSDPSSSRDVQEREPTYGTMESGAEPSSEMMGQLYMRRRSVNHLWWIQGQDQGWKKKYGSSGESCWSFCCLWSSIVFWRIWLSCGISHREGQVCGWSTARTFDWSASFSYDFQWRGRLGKDRWRRR